MFSILMVVAFHGFFYQMATAQYTILPIQNQPASNLNRQQLIHALLTTFDQPITPQRLELVSAALKEIPPKKNRIYLAELLKQTALQTLKVAASVCNAAEFAESLMRLPQQKFRSGYVSNEVYNYVPEVLTTNKGDFNYLPEVLGNFVQRKEVLTNYVPRKEILTNYVPRKEVVTNYLPEVLGNFGPRKEVLTNYLPEVLNNYSPRKEVLTNYVSDVPNAFVPRKQFVTNYVPEVLGNFVPRKEVLTNYLPKNNGYSTNLLANRAVAPYF